MEFLAVGMGGFLGCCLRFGMTKIAGTLAVGIPLATLGANVLAGFLMGIFMVVEQQMGWVSPKLRLFLTTGMLGGLSTFSTFNMETVKLFLDGRYLAAGGNVILNVGMSFVGLALGMVVAKAVLRKFVL